MGCLVHGSCPAPICHPSNFSHQEGEKCLKLLEGKVAQPQISLWDLSCRKSGFLHSWGLALKGLLSRTASDGLPGPRFQPEASRSMAHPSEEPLAPQMNSEGFSEPVLQTNRLSGGMLARCRGRESVWSQSCRGPDRLLPLATEHARCLRPSLGARKAAGIAADGVLTAGSLHS